MYHPVHHVWDPQTGLDLPRLTRHLTQGSTPTVRFTTQGDQARPEQDRDSLGGLRPEHSMNTTVWQKRYNVALGALAAWWAISAAGRVLVSDALAANSQANTGWLFRPFTVLTQMVLTDY